MTESIQEIDKVIGQMGVASDGIVSSLDEIKDSVNSISKVSNKESLHIW